MHFKIVDFNKSSFSSVMVTHGDENEMIFNCSGYSNTKPGAIVVEHGINRVQLFNEINTFIDKQLKKEDQLKLYQCYARLYNLFDESYYIGSDGSLEKLLCDEVDRIYKIIKFDQIRDYIVYNKEFKLPPELSDDYITEDKITPLYKQRTCRLSEYIDLVAMVFGLRFMIPVWGSYLPIAAKDHNKELKEYYAYQLLETCDFYKSPPFERLEIYVRANISEEDFDMSQYFSFFSSEELPIYLVAIVSIRKLSVAPLSAEIDKDHLMKIIYNYIFRKNTKLPLSEGRQIKDKKGPGEVNADDNSSVWCIYKMKENMSTGELETLQHYISKYRNAAERIEPDIDFDRLEDCIKRSISNHDFRAEGVQKGLAAWVLSIVIAGVAVDILDRHVLKIALGTAQAILWQWGFNQLAILLTATVIPLDEDEILTPIPKIKLSESKREVLDAICPYSYPESKRSELVIPTNPALRGIETMLSDFVKNDWEPNCPKTLAASVDRVDLSRRLEVSGDIRDQLANLLIKLDNHVG